VIEEKLKAAIRDIPDFPKPGILFKDITPILLEPKLCRDIVNEFIRHLKSVPVDAIVGVESRGFFFALLLSEQLNVPFIPARKPGKLPYKTISYSYDLEYGSAAIEVHADAIKPGWNVLVHDDLLATGGTACAAAELVKMQGGNVSAFAFIVNLKFLNGEVPLKKYTKEIISLVNY